MIRASSVLLWICLITAASVAFYRTSTRVQELNQQLHDLNGSIGAEQQSIHVLKAEWAYLSSPARIETATKKHLSLRPTLPRQIASLDDLADMLPSRSEVGTSVTTSAPPLASIRTSLRAPTPRPVVFVRHTPPAAAVLASADTSHISDHITIQHTASAQSLTDSIGALIGRLDSNP